MVIKFDTETEVKLDVGIELVLDARVGGEGMNMQ